MYSSLLRLIFFSIPHSSCTSFSPPRGLTVQCDSLLRAVAAIDLSTVCISSRLSYVLKCCLCLYPIVAINLSTICISSGRTLFVSLLAVAIFLEHNLYLHPPPSLSLLEEWLGCEQLLTRGSLVSECNLPRDPRPPPHPPLRCATSGSRRCRPRLRFSTRSRPSSRRSFCAFA